MSDISQWLEELPRFNIQVRLLDSCAWHVWHRWWRPGFRIM